MVFNGFANVSQVLVCIVAKSAIIDNTEVVHLEPSRYDMIIGLCLFQSRDRPGA